MKREDPLRLAKPATPLRSPGVASHRAARMRLMNNLYEDIPDPGAEEQFVELLARPGVRIARIVSQGHTSPPGYWYDQPEAEWIVVLEGEARLRFEDEPEARVLHPGDYVDIAPYRRHRVEWTHPDIPTVWLAVFHD